MNNGAKRTEIDLLRHGEHVLGDVICGVTDPKLSEAGWAQLHNQCARLVQQGAQWDVCITSPRQRCADFAEHLSQRLAIEYVVDDGFAEVDFGRWEGRSYREIANTYPGQWQAWLAQPTKPAPHGGDRYAEFLQRIHQSWIALINRRQGKRILLVIHGGVTRAIFASVFDLAPGTLFRFRVPHACHSRIIAYHQANAADWFQLDSHNSSSA
ncbi:histidine phosphatase family protein [Candidatus Spongiihabitans sp.]|uniref:histidine phosphatase family protein n=1 Tax=Candidatus Spongiihabitans sp. TaxID=3101308 RepID=UPI003C7EA74B